MTHRTGFKPHIRKSCLKALVGLFDRARLVTLLESKGEISENRCAYPITGVEDQSTCDLPVDPVVFEAQKKQAADDCLSGPVLCCVHFEKARFEAAGIDVDTVYDGTPFEADFRKKAQGPKPRV